MRRRTHMSNAVQRNKKKLNNNFFDKYFTAIIFFTFAKLKQWYAKINHRVNYFMFYLFHIQEIFLYLQLK